jgi:ADP-ribose pyrophosphatase
VADERALFSGPEFFFEAFMNKQQDVTAIAAGKRVRLVRRGDWEYVTRKSVSGIVAIVAVTDHGKLVLVEQFRPPVAKSVIELPAGLAGDEAGHEQEDLADAARRELLEETGYEAADMTFIAQGVPSAGITDEIITLFRATGLRKTGKGEGDGSEQITLHEVRVDGVAAWLERKRQEGRLVDLKVYAGLYFVGR